MATTTAWRMGCQTEEGVISPPMIKNTALAVNPDNMLGANKEDLCLCDVQQLETFRSLYIIFLRSVWAECSNDISSKDAS